MIMLGASLRPHTFPYSDFRSNPNSKSHPIWTICLLAKRLATDAFTGLLEGSSVGIMCKKTFLNNWN